MEAPTRPAPPPRSGSPKPDAATGGATRTAARGARREADGAPRPCCAQFRAGQSPLPVSGSGRAAHRAHPPRLAVRRIGSRAAWWGTQYSWTRCGAVVLGGHNCRGIGGAGMPIPCLTPAPAQVQLRLARWRSAGRGAGGRRAPTAPPSAHARGSRGDVAGRRDRRWPPRMRGRTAALKPSLWASLRRKGACRTARTAPDRAISPKKTRSGASASWPTDESRAAAAARSAAGSVIFNPPATLR